MRKLKFVKALLVVALTVPLFVFAQTTSAQTRDEQIRQDRDELAESDAWYYDDFEKATAVALAEKKPMMVVLRCIP